MKLVKLKSDYGEEFYNEVVRVKVEIVEYNLSGGYVVLEMWNFEKNWKVMMEEGMDVMLKMRKKFVVMKNKWKRCWEKRCVRFIYLSKIRLNLRNYVKWFLVFGYCNVFFFFIDKFKLMCYSIVIDFVSLFFNYCVLFFLFIIWSIRNV